MYNKCLVTCRDLVDLSGGLVQSVLLWWLIKQVRSQFMNCQRHWGNVMYIFCTVMCHDDKKVCFPVNKLYLHTKAIWRAESMILLRLSYQITCKIEDRPNNL